jgi:hypothetical protein
VRKRVEALVSSDWAAVRWSLTGAGCHRRKCARLEAAAVEEDVQTLGLGREEQSVVLDLTKQRQ